MPLSVSCLCGYLANASIRWRSEDYDSYKWIQALKGKELNKYALVPVRGETRRLSNENLPRAAQWFGELAADYLRKKKISGPFAVVPVPNSSSVVESTVRPQTRKLARAICDELEDDSMVLDCLRWKKNLGSASKEGGPREAEILYGNLAFLSEALDELTEGQEFKVLLVDDVTTSGGHLRACAAKLKTKKVIVDAVICGGKTVYDQERRAFSIREYSLDEYQP